VDGGRRVRQPHAKVIECIRLSDPHAAADGAMTVRAVGSTDGSVPGIGK
jgi:hypothetical protein